MKHIETFKELGLSENLIAVLEKNKITEPTEIQKKAIPFVLDGRDIVGVSATGSGKTLAFSVGILEKIDAAQRLNANLIIAEISFDERKIILNKNYATGGIE